MSEKKNKATFKRGYTKIKYGITFENQQLIKKEIRDIPIFYLNLSRNKLSELLKNIDTDLNKGLSEVELKTFDYFLDLLNEESLELENKNLPKQVKDNLDRFQNSLQIIKNIRKNH